MTTANRTTWVPTLLTDEKENGRALSLGRFSFLVVLGFLCALWVIDLWGAQRPTPPALMEVFYTISAYVFGSKVVEKIKKKKLLPDDKEDKE